MHVQANYAANGVRNKWNHQFLKVVETVESLAFFSVSVGVDV